jgi:hypothetical protein
LIRVIELLEKMLAIETSLQPTHNRIMEWHEYIDIIDSACKKWDTVENDNIFLKIGIDRSCLLKLKELLSHFKDVLHSLEDSNNPTLHLVHPSIDLLKYYCKVDPKDFKILNGVKATVLSGVNTTIIPSLTVEHKAAVFLLPPANKLKTFTANERDLTYSFVKNKMEKFRTSITHTSPNPKVDPEPTATTSNFALLSDIINQNYLDDDTTDVLCEVNAEFCRYLNEKFPQLPAQFDILAWWDSRKLDYPLLYKVSNSILAIPASAVACDDLFAKAQRLLNDTQSSQNFSDNLLVCSSLKHNSVKEMFELFESK